MPPKRPRKASTSTTRPAKKQRANSNTGRFMCPLCNHGFSRRTTVRDTHFPSCSRKNGNPRGLKWDQHASCKGRAKEGAWPSGRGRMLVGGSSSAAAEGEGEVEDGYEEMEVDDEEMGEGDGDGEGEGAEDGEVGDECLPEMMDAVAASEASTDVEDDIVMNMPLTSDTRVASSDTRLESSPTPKMRRAPLKAIYEAPGARISDSAGPSRRYVPPAPQPRFMMSSESMLQIANVAFMACREEAGISDLKAIEMYDAWYNELPPGHRTDIARPEPGWDVRSRQQAVVWVAQDVYSALTSVAGHVLQQLQAVSLARNITLRIGNLDGTRRIHELVKGQMGPSGTLLLLSF